MLQGKYYRCLMALEITVPSPCPPKGWCGGLLGAGAWCNTGRNADSAEICLGGCLPSLGALVERDAFGNVFSGRAGSVPVPVGLGEVVLGSDVVLGPVTLCSSRPASPRVEEVLGHGVMSLQLPRAGGQLVGWEEDRSSVWAEMVVDLCIFGSLPP